MTRRHVARRAIPEKYQKPWRERLKRLREGSFLTKTDLQADYGFHTGTMYNYETRDLSTMQISYLFQYAQALQIPFVDLIKYVFTDTDDLTSTAVQRANTSDDERFVHMVMSQLSPDLQRLAREQLASIANYAIVHTSDNVIVKRPMPKANPREILSAIAHDE